MAEIPAEVRERVEERFRTAKWKMYVCGESDGEQCGSGTTGSIRHQCAAAAAHRREEGPPPLVVFIEVEPTRYKEKG